MDPYERRIHIVFVFFLLALLGIVFRLVWIQALHRERFNNPTGIRYQHSQVLKAERGSLLDAEGRTLASCVEVWFVAANPQQVVNPDYWAHRLAGVLGMSETVLRDLLGQRLRSVVLREGAPSDLKASLQPLIQRGLIAWKEDPLPPTFSVLVKPSLVLRKAATVETLSQILGRPPAEIKAAVSSLDPWVELAREVDSVTAQQLKALSLAGVEVQEQPGQSRGRIILTPQPWDVRWTLVPQRGNPERKVNRPSLLPGVWRDLAPVWEGLEAPDKREIEGQIKCSFVFLKRQVPAHVGLQLKSWNQEWLIVDRERLRTYPFDHLARPLLGRTDVDEHGVSGLEKAYERVLSGVDGYRLSVLDAQGKPIPQMEGEYLPPIDGKDVVLTLDVRIQEFAEAALAQTLADHEADWGVALVLDPYTGEILALANVDRRGRSGSTPNYAFVKAYEPGSVFKPITVCAALEEGLVSPNTPFYCGGVVQVGSARLHCISFDTPRGSHGSETVSEAVRDSCNVVLLQVGRRLGQEKFEKWIRRLRLLERSGLSIVEQEACGQIYTRDPRGRWSPQKVATVSYGKGIQVTALALARAYCPIVNGGDLPRLRLIKRLIDRRGQTVVEIPSEVERGVLHPETAAEVRKMLHRVVWESPGTGRPARSPLYETAGKTGTSVGYHREDPRIVSFLGFAPYHRPRIICSVLVANPRKGSRTGAGTCGPAFRSIVEKTLDYLGVPPDTERLARLFSAIQDIPGAPDLPGARR